ncbi:hypothetical protein ACUN9Y_01745 [Halomonas sp. V046]|uniref:hypothetical protein n=1 Tax=Halomonas sp. V046 TaxID=3459611 RepID=UPI0040450B09
MRRAPLKLVLMLGLTLLLDGLGFACAQAQSGNDRDILIIANPGVVTQRLERDTARAIFAMRQRTWPDGQAAQVFVLSNSHPVHAAFVKERLSVYPHQLQLAWDRMVFSGTGQAPNRVRNQQQMRDAVATTPGAIGYIEREYVDERVQVITME